MTWLSAGIRPYLALTLLCLVLYLPGLAAVPPLDRDESRFAQATHQMMETGDYVRIRFQDEARSKKPVGIHWLQAAAVTAAGAPEAIWDYRLPSVLGAFVAALLTFAYGRGLFGRPAALVGAALTATALIVVAEAHQAKTDAVLLATVVAAQGALGRFYLRGRVPAAANAGLGTALVFWLAQGIGMLVKGPVLPMISILTIATLVVADRRAGWLRGLRPVMGLLVAGAIVGPWLAAMSQAGSGDFVGTAIKTDLLPKLLGAQEAHGGPPGLYLALLPLLFWPGSLFLPQTIARAWRERATPPVRFCLAWLLPSWLVFELVPTKLPHYTMPLLPALALLTGAVVLRLRPAGTGGRVWLAVWAVIGLVLAGAMVAAPLVGGGGFSPWSLPATAAALAAGLAPAAAAWRGDGRKAAGMAVGAAALTFAALFHGVLPAVDTLWVSERAAAAVAAAQPGPHPPVAAAGYHEPSLVFRLGTATRLTDGGAAARWLVDTPGALALVEAAQEAGFQKTLAALGHTARPIDDITGFNYSRGRPAALRLYRLEG